LLLLFPPPEWGSRTAAHPRAGAPRMVTPPPEGAVWGVLPSARPAKTWTCPRRSGPTRPGETCLRRPRGLPRGRAGAGGEEEAPTGRRPPRLRPTGRRAPIG
ncbi:unnamed protein product, partial [Ectocarpus sp. 13 AM-2016]